MKYATGEPLARTSTVNSAESGARHNIFALTLGSVEVRLTPTTDMNSESLSQSFPQELAG